jgi:uncharacterized low-complexity protein
MRKLSIYALALCLILGTAAVAMAKGTTHTHTMTAKGPITTVNAADKSFSVKGKTGDETFTVTATTKIEEHGKTISLADLKSGEEVSVWYTMKDGKNDATKVIVHSMKETHTKSAKPGARR